MTESARPHSSSAACNKQKSLPTRASECSRWPKWPSDCLSAARLRGRTHCFRRRWIGKELIDKKDFDRDCRRETGEGGFAGRAANRQDFAGDDQESRVLGNIAFHIAAENPSEAGRLDPGGPNVPARARRGNLLEAGRGRPAAALQVLEGMPWIDQKPGVFINLALGVKARDEGAARRAIEKGVAGLDKILRERPERYTMIAGSLLPAIEASTRRFARNALARCRVAPARSRSTRRQRILADRLGRDACLVRSRGGCRIFEPTRKQSSTRIPPSWRTGGTSFWRGRCLTPEPRRHVWSRRLTIRIWLVCGGGGCMWGIAGAIA